ncbi:MAG: thioredoxin domain-containing protein [Acidobacteria bacterium]|nr:thioredoxin domain-containing protein [Acidobacteriota bacterium]
MKFISILLLTIVFSMIAAAQTTEQVLATAADRKFTVKDLPADVAAAYVNLAKTVAETRRNLLQEQIAETIFALEAKARGTTADKLEEQIRAKVPAPAEKDVQAVYDANREQLAGQSLDAVRPQIVAFLKQEPEQKALIAFLTSIKAKYKILGGKDVNAAGLRPVDVLAAIGAKTITVKDFEDRNKVVLYETKAKVFDAVKSALNQLLVNALVAAEAKAQNIDTTDLLAREITDKLRDYTEEERQTLENDFRTRLFAKYRTQILLKEPAPLVLNIDTTGAPSKGPATAPVTVVMFSDFQCSHCAKTHPILLKVLAAYGDKVRFVLRDYPLVQIHPEAFQAAVAANAARAQGKFFEYVEILYNNQEALDEASLKRYAAGLGLNQQQFELDFKNAKNADAVRKDMIDGENYGVTATPTVFVNGVKVRVPTADGFREAIDKALKKQ